MNLNKNSLIKFFILIVLLCSITHIATFANSEKEQKIQTLISQFSVTTAKNNIVYLFGQLKNESGKNLSGTTIEIWQTDSEGIYDHPDDPSTNQRDKTFQFYGSEKTDQDGWYAFRTTIPGKYHPRPQHIHFKVKLGNKTLLTSQFYFGEDLESLKNERIFQSAGNDSSSLLLQLARYNGRIVAEGNIVVDGGSGSKKLTKTPRQPEGPYYPMKDLTAYDNDLLILE